MRLILFAAVLASSLPSVAAQSDTPRPDTPQTASVTQTEHTFAGVAPGEPVRLRYLLALPEGYESSGEAWPLVLFLHGSGERGDSLGLVSVHGPPKRVREGASFPFILVSPQQPLGRGWWKPRELAALLDEIESSYRIDPDRMYVTGLSMGGFGTWELLQAYPDRFAAAAPVCGGGTPGLICAARDVPIWAFHGGLDTVVPAYRTQEMVDRLEACEGDIRYTLYPNAGHDSWTETYANPELYEWLLSHRRGE